MISAGAPPQTPLGELTALPRPLAGLRGPTSKGKGKVGREGEGERRGGEQGRREGGGRPPNVRHALTPLSNPDFKVTTFLKSNIVKRGRLKDKVTIAQ